MIRRLAEDARPWDIVMIVAVGLAAIGMFLFIVLDVSTSGPHVPSKLPTIKAPIGISQTHPKPTPSLIEPSPTPSAPARPTPQASPTPGVTRHHPTPTKTITVTVPPIKLPPVTLPPLPPITLPPLPTAIPTLLPPLPVISIPPLPPITLPPLDFPHKL